MILRGSHFSVIISCTCAYLQRPWLLPYHGRVDEECLPPWAVDPAAGSTSTRLPQGHKLAAAAQSPWEAGGCRMLPAVEGDSRTRQEGRSLLADAAGRHRSAPCHQVEGTADQEEAVGPLPTAAVLPLHA